jgi:small redox-active disulfide protein 2
MATIQILGSGCSKCGRLLQAAEQVVKAAGRSDTIVKITDIVQMLEFAPSALPALAIDGKVVAAGRLATPVEIQQWLANAEETPC